MRVDIGDGVRLFVDADGSRLVPDLTVGAPPSLRERPTIIAMHGGPGLDHVGLRLGLGSLRDFAQVVVYDHRGHGRSDWRSAEEWNLDTWANDLVRLCDVLGIENPIVLGNSFGGFVAQRYLARHPGHASKVILYATMSVGNLETIVDGFRIAGGNVAADVAREFWSNPSAESGLRFQQVCRRFYTKRDLPLLGDPLTTRNSAVFPHFGTEMWQMDLRSGLTGASSQRRSRSCLWTDQYQSHARRVTTTPHHPRAVHQQLRAIATDEPEAFLAAILSFVMSE